MDKKAIKIILDVIKTIQDRPSAYGVQFTSHEHEGEKSYAYFTDGYVAIRLECGGFAGLHSINEDMWVSGTQLKGIYADLKAKDVCLNMRDDGEHADIKGMFDMWTTDTEDNGEVAINLDVFKKLAPLGKAIMKNVQKDDREFTLFYGDGFKAIACPLVKSEKERLNKFKEN